MNRDSCTSQNFVVNNDWIILKARIEKIREIAISLLIFGLDPNLISKTTGLSIEEIEELPRYIYHKLV